jgi:RNA polymerase sigma-70 factor (ECF subfamily)
MDEEQLIVAVKAQVPGAVEELVNTYGDRLLRSAFSLCGNETDAQDIVQDTFLQAIQSVHRFQGRSTIYTWLHAILLNLTRHYHRDRKRILYDNELVSRQVSTVDEDLGQLDDGAASSALLKTLCRLSVPHREVIILRYYENMKIHEIASHQGVSKGTVKSRLHYAIRELQKLLPGELNLFGGCGTEKVRKP